MQSGGIHQRTLATPFACHQNWAGMRNCSAFAFALDPKEQQKRAVLLVAQGRRERTHQSVGMECGTFSTPAQLAQTEVWRAVARPDVVPRRILHHGSVSGGRPRLDGGLTADEDQIRDATGRALTARPNCARWLRG
jgi:hypothetical protein